MQRYALPGLPLDTPILPDEQLLAMLGFNPVILRPDVLGESTPLQHAIYHSMATDCVECSFIAPPLVAAHGCLETRFEGLIVVPRSTSVEIILQIRQPALESWTPPTVMYQIKHCVPAHQHYLFIPALPRNRNLHYQIAYQTATPGYFRPITTVVDPRYDTGFDRPRFTGATI